MNLQVFREWPVLSIFVHVTLLLSIPTHLELLLIGLAPQVNFSIATTTDGPIVTSQTSGCEPNPCLNGGQCLNATSGPSCYCSSFPYTDGERCEINVLDASPVCPTNPCLNGGTCVRLLGGDFMCACSSGYSGRVCDVPPNNSLSLVSHCFPNPCMYEGICSETATGFRCTCIVPLTGNMCQEIPNGTDMCDPNPCQNAGVCTGGLEGDFAPLVCVCSAPYQGMFCKDIQGSDDGKTKIIIIAVACSIAAILGAICLLFIWRRIVRRKGREREGVATNNSTESPPAPAQLSPPDRYTSNSQPQPSMHRSNYVMPEGTDNVTDAPGTGVATDSSAGSPPAPADLLLPDCNPSRSQLQGSSDVIPEDAGDVTDAPGTGNHLIYAEAVEADDVECYGMTSLHLTRVSNSTSHYTTAHQSNQKVFISDTTNHSYESVQNEHPEGHINEIMVAANQGIGERVDTTRPRLPPPASPYTPIATPTLPPWTSESPAISPPLQPRPISPPSPQPPTSPPTPPSPTSLLTQH
ncbi:protocadherin Fat 3-like [Sycon ciliatum]|uniref:protocadherin Fat 3-like n=1 Tax=Sycon ciliatum TaxID=27933 RepID=UPI0031F61CDE